MPAWCPHRSGAPGCLLGVRTDLEHLDACLVSAQIWSTWMPAWCPHRSGAPGCLLGVHIRLEHLDACLVSTQIWSTWMPALCPHRSGASGCLLGVHGATPRIKTLSRLSSMCASVILRAMPAGIRVSLVGLTMPDWSRMRFQTKSDPWSSRFGVGRQANNLLP